ncbi:MAG: hypothetical protein A2068_04035 [Ignavibacteria bacterium GWB2_35_6b]|nr:MAG: hypothetical protein A2068_04035 [Ignavibacteria bacterium GWB2_35_6b]
MKIIGVDVGGTKISVGLIENEQVVKQYSCPTPFDAEKLVVVDAIARAIGEVFYPEVAGIGIGVPGLVDHDKNMVIDVTNIPSWDEVPLKDLLQERFGKPVFVNNDANCFAIGEKYFGKGKPFSNFVGLAIGTGLGAGIIINGHLYSGKYSGAGEFGCLYYLDNNTEAYCSGQFFSQKLNLSGEDLFNRVEKGDKEAAKIFNEFGIHLGKAISVIMLAVDPEVIILGGSVSKAYKYFKDAVMISLQNFPYKNSVKNLKIITSNLTHIAILGAAALYFENRGIMAGSPEIEIINRTSNEYYNS